MQPFYLALGATLLATALSAPTKTAIPASVPEIELSIDTLTPEMLETDWEDEKRHRRAGVDLNSNGINDYLERHEEPCAILLDGYRAPICDMRPSGYSVTEVTALPFAANDGTAASWQMIKIENAVLQTGKGAKSKQADCEGIDEHGNTFPTAAEWASIDHVDNKYPGTKLMCAVTTGHHKSRISGAHSCAELCDMVPDCHSFTTKAPHCWLYNLKEENLHSSDAMVYSKSTNKQYKGTLQERTYFKATDTCESTAQVNYPCYPEDGFKWGTVTKNDVSTMSSALTWGTDETPWLGTAPAEFMAGNVGSNTIAAKYEPSASFSAADPDCGCEYGTWTTGIKSGAAVGYGVYEAKLTSTASEFTNAFWFQGASTEINVLKVNEEGKATVSYHCFNDEGSTVSDESAEFDVDLTQDTTATLIFTADKIEVAINNVIVYDVATPACMQGVTMKPIFSIETGDELPTESVAADGTMTIDYFKTWADVSVPTNGGDYTCPSIYSDEYSSDSRSVKCFADAVKKFSYAAATTTKAEKLEKPTVDGRKCGMMGPYQGLSAGINYAKGLCGMKPLRMEVHKMFIESEQNFRIYGPPSVGGSKCDTMPGCNAIAYNVDEMYSMLFTSGTTRTDEATEYVLFLRKTENTPRTCPDELGSAEWRKVCHVRARSGSKFYRCPATVVDDATKKILRNQVTYDSTTGLPDRKTGFSDKTSAGITSKSVVAGMTLEQCRQITEASHTSMMAHFASEKGVAVSEIPAEWGCNSFEYRAATPFQPGYCSPTQFSTTSDVAGQFNNLFNTWITTKHNVEI
jgi:hypothetical protein